MRDRDGLDAAEAAGQIRPDVPATELLVDGLRYGAKPQDSLRG